MKNTKMMIVMIILLLVVGGGAFYLGMNYQQNRRRGNFQFGPQTGNQTRQFQARNGQARPVRGEIIAADDKSITVKLPDGSSRIVLLSSNTSINKATQGTKDDLKTGEQVFVVGSDNSDGSVTAQNIQLNPAVGFNAGNQNISR